MAYVPTDDPTMKIVLTNSGKEIGFKEGFLNIFKYFTISDSAIIYTLDVNPDSLPNVNGSHEKSTNRPSGYNTEITTKI
jgi:hypothetical protein